MSNKRFTPQDQSTLEDIMQHRRDIRGNRFLNTAISDEDLQTILHAASLAPSVGYSQPWEFVIIKNTETKQHIAKNFERENSRAQQTFDNEKQKQYTQLKLEGIIESPLNIAVFYKPENKPVLGQNSMREMGEYSVVCAIQNMWLMARSLNIGLGWVSILNPEAVKQTLNAPDNYKLIAYLCIGHVDDFLEKPELETLNWEKKRQFPVASYMRHINEDFYYSGRTSYSLTSTAAHATSKSLMPL